VVSRVVKLVIRGILIRGISCCKNDVTEMPHKTMNCNSFPIVLNKNHSFSNLEETLNTFSSYFELYCIYIIIIIIIITIIILDSKKKVEKKGCRGCRVPPKVFL